MTPTVVTQITDSLTANMTSVTGLIVTAGLAIIGLAFAGFALAKGRRAAGGNVK